MSEQRLAPVQILPSSQGVPLGKGTTEHKPVVGEQVPSAQAVLNIEQSLGEDTQTPL